jgi:hypothetical protein
MPKFAGRFNSLVVPLITWLILLIPFAIYQLYYVKSQEAYLTEHGFRVLTAVGRQLDAFLFSINAAVETAGSREARDPSLSYANYLRSFLPITSPSDLEIEDQSAPTGTVSIQFGIGPNIFERRFPQVPASGQVRLDKGLRDRLKYFRDDYFDDILIAKQDGTVLFQKSPEIQIINLDHLIPAQAGPAANKPSGSAESSAATQPRGGGKTRSLHETLPFAALAEASNVVAVRLAGEDYKLFLQPFLLSGGRSDEEPLILCGLWRTERLSSASIALPYSAVIWFGLFCLAAGCFVWPFLKINYMSCTERLRQSDGWLLVLSMFLGASCITLMVLNGAYASQVKGEIDDDLDTLSKQIQTNVTTEIRLALSELAALSADPQVAELERQRGWHPRTSVLNSLGKAQHPYRYFDLAFWMSEDGQQQVKYTVDLDATPQTNIRNLVSFQAALTKAAPHEGAITDYSLEPLISPNTGLFSTVIAAPYYRKESTLKVQALVMRPLSLVEPVLPPSFGFAVLTEDGDVLFHSSSARNLYENFIQECKEPSVVQAALFSESPQNIDLVYSGVDRRARLTKLRGIAPEPVTLVVFHNTNIDQTANLALVTTVAVLFGLYTLAIVVVAIIDIVRGAAYAPRAIWPSEQRSSRYLLVCAINGLLVLAFATVYSHLSELRLFLVTGVVIVAGIAATVGVITLTDPSRELRPLDEALAPHFKLAYVAAGVSLLVVATLVPCLGFFKFAHDAVNELVAKHEELTLFKDVMEREGRISKYYQRLKPKDSIATDRSAETLDRFDELPLRFLSFHDTQEKERDDQGDLSFDLWLAWATRLFPSNQLGHELRMLRFESPADPASSSVQWHELAEKNSFRISATGPKYIDATFTPWSGIALGGWTALVLLWLAVGYWCSLLMKRVLLPDRQRSLQVEAVTWAKGEDIKFNALVLTEPECSTRSRLADIKGRVDYCDLRLHAAGQRAKLRFDYEVVVLDYFDFQMDTRLDNLTRLQLLERLLYKERKRVVLGSSVDPVYYLSASNSAILADDRQEAAELLRRWVAAMSSFRTVEFADAGGQQFEQRIKDARKERGTKRLAGWIKDECGHAPFLREIGLALLADRPKIRSERQWVLSEIGRRAEAYYSQLWSTLTNGERLTLYQLSRDGWANPKNDRAMWQLQSKGMIYADPMFRMMSESFRLFSIVAQDADEIAEWERQGKQSSWRTVKFSLIATALALAAWLFYAQKDLFQGAVGYIVTLGGAVAAIANLLGNIRGRAGTPEKAPDTAA